METLEIVRSYRIGGFTLFDTGLTIAAVLLLAPFLTRLFRKVGLETTMLTWFLFALPLSVAAHIVTLQDTTLTRQILDPSGNYVSKIVVLALLVAGILSVRRVIK